MKSRNLFFKLKFDIENIFKDPKLVYQKLFEINQPKPLEDHVLCWMESWLRGKLVCGYSLSPSMVQ